MSRYDIDDCVQKWAKETLSPDQAIGQLLLHVQNLDERVKELEKENRELRAGTKE